MIVQAAQWGWLLATPPKQKTTRLRQYGKAVGILESFPGDYLLRILLDVGPTDTGSETEKRVSFQELRAYTQMLEMELRPWEVRTIVDASSAYLNAKRIACSNALAMQPVESPDGYCRAWLENPDRGTQRSHS